MEQHRVPTYEILQDLDAWCSFGGFTNMRIGRRCCGENPTVCPEHMLPLKHMHAEMERTPK